MFKFGHTYIEPNKFLSPNRNGRIYPNVTQEEYLRVFHEVANRIAEQGRHGLANFIIVSEEFYDRFYNIKNGFKFGR